MDLILKNARIAGREAPGTADIGIEDVERRIEA